jgi:hypothetical protein
MRIVPTHTPPLLNVLIPYTSTAGSPIHISHADNAQLCNFVSPPLCSVQQAVQCPVSSWSTDQHGGHPFLGSAQRVQLRFQFFFWRLARPHPGHACVMYWVGITISNRRSSPNLTEGFETPKPHPQHGKPPIEVLVSDTSRDGRAGGAPLTQRRAHGAPKCASRPCALQWHDTQEIAKSFWSYFLWRFKQGLCLNYLLAGLL